MKKKIFQITAAEAMLLGATSAIAQGGTSQGTFYADVPGKLEVNCSSKSSAEVIPIVNDAAISGVDGIKCAVTTNEPVWDLTITLSSPALVNTVNNALKLKTTETPNGVITLGVKYENTVSYGGVGNLLLGLKGVKQLTNAATLNPGTERFTKGDVNAFATQGGLANAFQSGAQAFGVDGENTVNFEIKAGIVGTEITSPAGRYESQVTVTVEVPN